MSTGENKERPNSLRDSTGNQNRELERGTGIIGNYLQSLQRTLLQDSLQGRQRNMFSSTLFLLIWLNKNTNIDIIGLKEILNGGYTVIENDNGNLYYRVCQLAKQERDIERGTAPYFVSGKRISHTPESSHDSCPSRGENAKCITPSDKDQIRMGQGLLYDCNENGVCNRNKSSKFFDLIVGVQCLDGKKGHKNTWFQFEYARMTGSTVVEKVTNKYLLHVYSFLCYVATACTKNQGTFGTSRFVENGRYYRLLMNNNNTTNITSSQDVRNNLNIITEEEKKNFIKRYKEKPVVFTIQGGKRKTRRRKTRKTRRKRMKKSKRCCVGPGCPEWQHCIHVVGDPERNIRAKSPATLKSMKKCEKERIRKSKKCWKKKDWHKRLACTNKKYKMFKKCMRKEKTRRKK
tara:strand:+ start:941 stop:2152 length:1212 start_codon:yes stop_codon:yes gene_type:complete